MGKSLLSFAAGVALTALAFVYFGDVIDSGSTDSVRNASASPAIPPISESSTGVDMSAAPANVEAPSRPAESERPTNNPPGSPLRGLTQDQLESMRTESQRNARLAEDEMDRRQRVERWANEPAPQTPIVMPPEFAWLADNPSDFYEGIQREPVDPQWSPMAEARLQSYFSERRAITERFGYPTINCRKSGCVIAFVAYGIDNTDPFPAAAARAGTTPELFTDQDFLFATIDFRDQPWVGQFLIPNLAPRVETANGATTFLISLPRGGQ